MVTQASIGIVVGKIDASMAINHISNNGNAMLVRDINELLKV